jgi:hypothetical protein
MSPKKKTRPSDLARWARRATAALDQTNTMIGFLGDHNTNGERYWSFAVQVGHCLLEGKPLLLLAPVGFEVPPHLKAAAPAVEYYIQGNEASVEDATKRAVARLGIVVKH